MVEVRWVQAQEVDEIVALIERVAESDAEETGIRTRPWADTEEWDRQADVWADGGQSAMFLAVEDGRWVGAVWLEGDGQVARAYGLWVDPDCVKGEE